MKIPKILGETLVHRYVLLACWIFVLLHTVKDFFQDFLEWDVLTFADANEDLYALDRLFQPLSQWGLPAEALAKAGRWLLALANETAVWVGIILVVLTPFVLKRRQPILEKLLAVGYFFFFLVLTTDLLLDPRIRDPQRFFDPSTRIPAHDAKRTYREILRDGPF